MTIKSILKNILPHFMVAGYIKRKNKQLKQTIQGSTYMQTGDSILMNNFKVDIVNPTDRKYVHIGDDCMLDCQVFFESGAGQVIIGSRVFIGNSKIICRSKIEFGNNIFVAWGVYFYDHNSHSLDYKLRQEDISQQLKDFRNGEIFIKNKNWDVVDTAPIIIGDNAWIGMNAIILKGVTIGEGAIVGAGSVVTKSVDPWTIVAGNPAVQVRKLEIPSGY